jgi:hypothetical protein
MLLPSFLLSLAVGGSLVAASPIKRNNGSPTVTIANGTVEGVSLSTFNQDGPSSSSISHPHLAHSLSFTAFLGVPFAQPPIGDLRLRHPRSLNTTYTGGKYEAKAYPKFCAGVGLDNWGRELSECVVRSSFPPKEGKEE